MLRRRYQPDWKPSWEGTKRPFILCEDGQSIRHPYVLDATRVSDGSIVTLKRTSKSKHPYEVDIGRYFSSESLASDPRNHCVPILDVLQDSRDEDILILVMLLLREYDDPQFETVGEVIDFLRQVFHGLQFMHQHHVAHRDITSLNVMMDPTPMFPKLYHPRVYDKNRDFTGNAKYYPRTERPTKYYITDFGLSSMYNPEDGPPQELPIVGGDSSVPEFQDGRLSEPSNPFPIDIYCLGNSMRQDIIEKYSGPEFMNALIVDMVQENPQKHPTID
ncbi:hypothetical protein AcW1_008783 [Taiwanofungus camphoratus]|nr:hypothetical protein AcV5_006815 [Antrodia cinnamomea]KAI0949082.1 hypothetical protein AcW1_008783 [Antrodia cinnamomea]